MTSTGLPNASGSVPGKSGSGKSASLALLVSLLLYACAALFVTGPAQTRLWLALYAGQWLVYLGILRWGCVSAGRLLLAAFAFRALLSFTPVWLSDDLFRYLLDGRVLASGMNPFRYAPAHELIAQLQPGLSALVNHPDVPTIYPPLAQLLGLGAALLHLDAVGWRLGISLLDLATIAAVARLFGGGERGWKAAAVYGLCPLAVWESGANGHLEGVTALFFVLGVDALRRNRSAWGGAGLGAAALLKMYPLLLLPLFLRGRAGLRFSGVALVVFALGWLPFFWGDVDPSVGLRTYLAHWSFNSPVYSLLAALSPWEGLVRAVPFAFLAVGGLWAARRGVDARAAIPGLVFGFLILGPTLHPWYALWVLPWLGPRPSIGLLGFVGAMGLGYEVWWEVEHSGVWRLGGGWSVLIWGLVGMAWIVEYLQKSAEKRRLAAHQA